MLRSAPILCQMIGLDLSESPYLKGILSDTKQIRNRAFHYIAEFFKARAQVGR